MANTVYSNTILAEVLSDVLQELVQAGQLSEQLAVATLEQLTQSTYEHLVSNINAKGDIQAKLHTYKYFDNVWQFVLQDVVLRINATGQGSAKRAPEVAADSLKLVCVDAKLAAAV